MTLKPSLDQALRIEALKLANFSNMGLCVYPPERVIGRAEAYLAFLKAKTPAAKSSGARGEK
jgi:hypothetical protein